MSSGSEKKTKKKKKGFSVKEPFLKAPFMESLAVKCSTTRAFLHSYIKVPGIRAPPPKYQVPHRWKGALKESGDFLISSKVPCEGAPPKRRGTLTHRKWGKLIFFNFIF
jgi:hypothetical protein